MRVRIVTVADNSDNSCSMPPRFGLRGESSGEIFILKKTVVKSINMLG